MLNTIDPAEDRITLDDSAAELACLVNRCYGGDEFVIDMDNLLACSRIALKYDVPRLQRAIDAFVTQLKLSDANVAHCMAVAHDNPGMLVLKERSIDYAAKRLQHVLALR